MMFDLRKFLDKYFAKEDLQDALNDIGEPYSAPKNELISRIIENWPNYRRNWNDILDYADDESLEFICDDYGLDSDGNRDLLIRRIKRAEILEKEKLTSTITRFTKSPTVHRKNEIPNINFNIGAVHFSTGRKIGIFSIIATVIALIIGMAWTSLESDTAQNESISITNSQNVQIIKDSENIQIITNHATYELGQDQVPLNFNKEKLCSNKNGELYFVIPNPNWFCVGEITDYLQLRGRMVIDEYYLDSLLIGRPSGESVLVSVYKPNLLDKTTIQDFIEDKRAKHEEKSGSVEYKTVKIIDNESAYWELENPSNETASGKIFHSNILWKENGKFILLESSADPPEFISNEINSEIQSIVNSFIFVPKYQIVGNTFTSHSLGFEISKPNSQWYFDTNLEQIYKETLGHTTEKSFLGGVYVTRNGLENVFVAVFEKEGLGNRTLSNYADDEIEWVNQNLNGTLIDKEVSRDGNYVQFIIKLYSNGTAYHGVQILEFRNDELYMFQYTGTPPEQRSKEIDEEMNQIIKSFSYL